MSLPTPFLRLGMNSISCQTCSPKAEKRNGKTERSHLRTSRYIVTTAVKVPVDKKKRLNATAQIVRRRARWIHHADACMFCMLAC